MKLTEAQYGQIQEAFPKHRREARYSNLEILNAILYVLENGCKWRCLPKEYGNWNTVYVRMRRWTKSGVLQRAFILLQEKGIMEVSVRVMSIDSTSVKVHPDGMGALKNMESNPLGAHGENGTQKYIWLPLLTGQP